VVQQAVPSFAQAAHLSAGDNGVALLAATAVVLQVNADKKKAQGDYAL
jgi:hypothetical protein